MWWEHWFDNETAQRIDAIIASGMVKMRDGCLHMQTTQLTKPYWMHVSGSSDCRNCLLWYEIFFGKLDIIHSFCRYNCWKCVTRPRNVRETIQMYNLMYVVPFVYNFINPIPGKAGIDIRHHTGQPYGVFQYATSMTEALRIKEIMIHMITTYLPNEKIDGKHLQDTVFVKRACTEFEARVPGDKEWWNEPQTREEWEIEHRLEDIFENPVSLNMQPAWLKDKVLQYWLNHANSIGDKSVKDFVGGDIFSVHSRQYTFNDLKPKQGGDPKKSKAKPKKREGKKGAKAKEK